MFWLQQLEKETEENVPLARAAAENVTGSTERDLTETSGFYRRYRPSADQDQDNGLH